MKIDFKDKYGAPKTLIWIKVSTNYYSILRGAFSKNYGAITNLI